ncbi:hypothetical protein RRG08_047235 [Elysia crispata]|uniref:PAC domain-containing protein n=1 Tax=Elysia crispata TaxID=231223 RepID=A0AAE1A304_9GAST|nr:hypothetical protein RRG08_047235 [Elysia crispata]
MMGRILSPERPSHEYPVIEKLRRGRILGKGARFLCSVLVAPVKNETGDIIMFIINYEDITESTSKNELRKFTNNRHRSFKLRLPSIRRDIRSRVKGGGSSPGGGERSPQQQPADPENPTLGEEAVPLNSLGQAGGGGGDEFDGKDEAGGSGGSDPSAGVYSRLHPAHSSIKEEEEGEGEDGGRSLGQNRAVGSGKEAIDSKRESEELLTMMRDGADVDRGEESSNRDGGGADQDPARVSVDNLSIDFFTVPNGRRRAHTLESSSPSANHVKSNFVNQQQASSDSELHRGHPARHLNDSLTNLGDGTGRRPQDGGVTARGIILPNVANMKQNVSEKVAQLWFSSFTQLLLRLASDNFFPWISTGALINTLVLSKCSGFCEFDPNHSKI